MKLNTIYTTFNGVNYYPTNYKDYLISELGEVLSIKYNKFRILKPYSTGKYLCVWIKGKSKKIHKIMEEVFFDNPDGKQINHKDGIKTNNRKDNLELLTPKENVIHAFEVLGRKPSKGNLRITDKQVNSIVNYKSNGYSNASIGRLVGFSDVHIGRILKQL